MRKKKSLKNFLYLPKNQISNKFFLESLTVVGDKSQPD